MKTMKQSLLLLITSLGATVAFAQVGVGVTTHANANAAKSINATTQAATKASTHAATHGKSAVTTAGSKAAEVKASTATKATQVSNGAQKNAKGVDVRTEARVNGELNANAHASENGKAHANENSVLNNTEVSTTTEGDVKIDGKKSIERTKAKKAKVRSEVDAKKDATLTKEERAKAKAERKAQRIADKAAQTEGEVKAEGRTIAQGSAHASDKAKEHANEGSAVFGAKSETTTSGDVQAGKNGVSGKSATKTKASGKVKKG
jgi:hypothetical protein